MTTETINNAQDLKNLKQKLIEKLSASQDMEESLIIQGNIGIKISSFEKKEYPFKILVNWDTGDLTEVTTQLSV